MALLALVNHAGKFDFQALLSFGAQLYVNCGIGTTGFPIRLGARPEITVLELVRGV